MGLSQPNFVQLFCGLLVMQKSTSKNGGGGSKSILSQPNFVLFEYIENFQWRNIEILFRSLKIWGKAKVNESSIINIFL